MFSPEDAASAAQMFIHLASGSSVEEAASSAVGLSPERLEAAEWLLAEGRKGIDMARAFQSAALATPTVPRPPTAPVPPLISPADQPVPPATTTKLVAGAERETGTRRILAGVKDYREIRHVGEELIKNGVSPMPRAVPRQKSRGNALLYLLSNYGKRDGLTTDDLVYGFQRMHILADDDADPRKKVTWELNELQRKGWPVEHDGKTWRLTLNGGA